MDIQFDESSKTQDLNFDYYYLLVFKAFLPLPFLPLSEYIHKVIPLFLDEKILFKGSGPLLQNIVVLSLSSIPSMNFNQS